MDHSSVFRTMLPTLDDGATTHITIAYPPFASRLPLVRLGRHGLVFRAHGTMPPVFGVPRSATLYLDEVPLCTLRLIVRQSTPRDDGTHDLTMQPSTTNGDALLWHALHAHCRDAGMLAQQDGAAQAAPSDAASRGASPASATPADARPTRSAAFRLADRGDARFFVDWLEYHFDELRALAQGHSPGLHLNELEHRQTGDEVDVRFVYDIDGHADRQTLTDCARRTCDWITAEVRRRFDLPIAEQRFGMRKPHRPSGYSFSSK